MITGQTLFLTAFLTVTWGVYFVAMVREYLAVTRGPLMVTRTRRQETIRAFRKAVVGLCVFILPLSVAVRTSLIVLGFGTDVAGAIVFFMLVAPNVIGSIFCDLSLRYD